ncbi:phosphoinositide 3-kinase adapter protein 1 isoform X2 [Pleurodeles waltl]|uniref:phosphoinositide 3-kinase adapter protein 1 isoform X2 n=1 Tax=Pleurodeles waltl TaxID=8319 RepID=UPI00370946F8
MAGTGTADICDVLIVHGSDGSEWCQYLKDLFLSSIQVKKQNLLGYEVDSNGTLALEDLQVFWSSKCIVILLSKDLVMCFSKPSLIENLQKALHPPQKVVVLFCGVTDCEEFGDLFKDWPWWKKVSCDDDADAYIAAVTQTIFKDSACESATDTETELERSSIYSKKIETNQEASTVEIVHSNLVVVFPERIRCGAETRVFIITKCKFASPVNIEVEFILANHPSRTVQGTLENEYTIYFDAPDLPSGCVTLKVYCDDLMICEGQIKYYTDMEEIRSLLENATNPVEFMCQAFKIVPYNIEALDKLLTESLKNNIPASGLHLFGIHQIEEDDASANQRDDELPTLLHFAAKYGLKNLTALLLTCPGALQAYSVCNKHGDFPNGIAEKHGYKDLRQFMDDYVETMGMLKTHFKEEMMQEEDDDDALYEPMAGASTELLMKCSLNPGCNEDLYESMVGLTTENTSEDLYVQMKKPDSTHSIQPGIFSVTSKESIIRKFLKDSGPGVPENVDAFDRLHEDGTKHHLIKYGTMLPDMTKRRPEPVPVPESCSCTEEDELYISKVFAEKSGQTRPENIYVQAENLQQEPASISRKDRPSSSMYDPYAGMKTPGQRQLITLQEQVKSGMITVDEAVLRFKEWHLNQKRRSESFKYQQENLQRLRESITRRQGEGRKKGLQITKPIKHGEELPSRVEYDVYECYPRKSIDFPKSIQRRTWNTESSSSTGSSTSDRSSTRSTLSFSSGVEADSEDNEIPELRSGQRAALHPPSRPPRIPPRNPTRTQSSSFHPPPVPPRGR